MMIINNYTESPGTSTNSNAEKSSDTNKMSNKLGLGDSNTENKTNEFNDTANDQDNNMNLINLMKDVLMKKIMKMLRLY